MIEIKEYTTKKPLTMIGELSGVCYGSNTSDEVKNIKRALENISSGHGRTLELPDVYVVIDGYSAKMMRELYTHIGGGPTRLQASTRYIDYTKKFNVITPKTVLKNEEALKVWNDATEYVSEAMKKLKDLGVPREDFSNLLPIAYESKMVWKVNLRALINFMEQRLCARAYWEMRDFANELKKRLSDYSAEWSVICDMLFQPKCEAVGFCTESKCCGRKPKKDFLDEKEKEEILEEVDGI